MSITFRCPRCGKRMTVEDRFGGQAGPCAHCGELVLCMGIGGMLYSAWQTLAR
jgi:DNA-directed RNA polymerase subunit RPC12/RpoP